MPKKETDLPSNRLKKQIDAMETRQKTEVAKLRPMQLGAARFIQLMEAQIEETKLRLKQLDDLAPVASHKSQIQHLQRDYQDLSAMKEVAVRILEELHDQNAPAMTAEQLDQFSQEKINPLMRAAVMYKFKSMRLLGRLVKSEDQPGEKCLARVEEAYAFFAKAINAETSRKDSQFGGLWRWFVSEPGKRAFWLYKHDPVEKWKCIFFKISINSVIDDLSFRLEGFVPIGVGSDPSDYALESSNVYSRDGWNVSLVSSMTESSQNTFNMSATKTVGTTASEGKSITDNKGKTWTNSISLSEGSQWGESWSTAETDSWFQNSSSNYSNSSSADLLGGSSTSGWGSTSGSSFATTRTQGGNTGTTKTTTWGDSEAVNIGRAVGVNTSLTDSVSDAISAGFASTDGKSLQTQAYAYGINYGAKPEDLLEKWIHGNVEAGETFKDVVQLFETMCKRTVEHIHMTAGDDDYKDPTMQQCVETIRRYMPVYDQLSAPDATKQKLLQAKDVNSGSATGARTEKRIVRKNNPETST